MAPLDQDASLSSGGALSLGGALLLVGAGKMGSALLRGWLEEGLDPDQVYILDPAPGDEIKALESSHGIHLNAPPQPAAIVVLAVKPQIMADILPTLSPHLSEQSLVISVAAGTAIDAIKAGLGAEYAIIRVMPNTPAAIGQGISVGCPSARVSEQQKQIADRLLQAAGEVAWVDDESLIDPVTGVSGSGPAYVFHLCEALAAAGEEQGLSKELAMQLAKATIAGAGALMMESTETPAQLRQNVTSPNGTTAAALEVLMDESAGLPALMRKAVAAATARAKELSK